MGRPSKAKLAKRAHIANVNSVYHHESVLASIRSSLRTTHRSSHVNQLEKLRESIDLGCYYFLGTGSEIRCIIIGLLKNDIPLIQCAHLRVGSSQVIQLLASKYTLRNAHNYYNTGKDRIVGAHAEKASAQLFNYPSVKKESRSLVKVPFIIATPDFVLDDRIIEVKSHLSNTPISKENVLQLLLSMEIFSKTKGEIHLYRIEKEGDTVKSVELKEVRAYVNEHTLFTEEFVYHAAIGYLNYITILLNALRIKVDTQSISQGLQLLIENSKRMTSESVVVEQAPTSKMCLKCMSKVKIPIPLYDRKRSTHVWSLSSRYFNHFRESDDQHHINLCEIARRVDSSISICSKVASKYVMTENTVNVDSFNREMGRYTNKREHKEYNLEVNIVHSKYEQKAFVCTPRDLYNLLISYYPLKEFGNQIYNYNFL